MRKGLVYAFGMISVFGLAIACQSGKSSRAANTAHAPNSQAAELPSPQFDSQLQTRGTQNLPPGTSRTTRTSIVTLKCVDNGGPQCDLLKIMEMQREANIIFNQAWKAIFRTTNDTVVSDVNSVFQVTLMQMKQLYRADGVKVSASPACNKTRPVFENLSTKAQTRYVLSVADCQNEARRKELVTFQKTSQDQWTMTYTTSNMPKSALGTSLQFLGKPVVCTASMNESLKLSALNCTGLGQATPTSVANSSDAFTEFQNFHFAGMTSANILQISGAKNRSIQDHEASTFNMSVPVNGPILYSEKIIVTENISEQPTSAGQTSAVVAPTQPVAGQQAQPVMQPDPTVTPNTPAAQMAAQRHAAPDADQKRIQERTELLSVLTEEDRRLFDLSKPEEQQQMLQQLREEKAQAEATSAQARQAPQAGQDPAAAQALPQEVQSNEQTANFSNVVGGVETTAQPINDPSGAPAVEAQDQSAPSIR